MIFLLFQPQLFFSKLRFTRQFLRHQLWISSSYFENLGSCLKRLQHCSMLIWFLMFAETPVCPIAVQVCLENQPRKSDLWNTVSLICQSLPTHQTISVSDCWHLVFSPCNNVNKQLIGDAPLYFWVIWRLLYQICFSLRLLIWWPLWLTRLTASYFTSQTPKSNLATMIQVCVVVSDLEKSMGRYLLLECVWAKKDESL